MNRVSMTGRLAVPPKLLTKPDSEFAVVQVKLAVSVYANKKNTTEYFTAKLFGNNASAALKSNVGDKVGIEGKLRNEPYVKDGTTYYNLYIECDRYEYMSRKQQEDGANASAPAKPAAQNKPAEKPAAPAQKPAPAPAEPENNPFTTADDEFDLPGADMDFDGPDTIDVAADEDIVF